MNNILIIGATSGIGRALTIALRAEGVTVVAAGRREALLKTLGGETVVLDITAPEAMAQVAAINAQGIIFAAGFGAQTAEPDWEQTQQTLNLQVVAFERLAQWALTHCEAFVAIASIAGIRGLENTNGYSPSKAYMIAAMEGYRRKCRQEKKACRFITVMPGFVDTAMGQASDFWRSSPQEAACCILQGLNRFRSVIYVTPRWQWIAILMRMIPRGLFERIRLS
ncbi:MAG: SDR family NAD(P)-dependent oxidoreductase [Kiritimatiellia bacterium]